MRLDGKAALVTGAAGGIGQAIAERLASAGARVCIADLQLASAQAVARRIEGAFAVEMDVTDERSVERAVEATAAELGGVDVLVSNAGIQLVKPLHELSFAEWKRVTSVHLDGAYLTTHACLRHMYASGRGGSIVYIGSKYSKEGAAFKAPYVAAKHALIGLARVVAIEGAEHGVRSNVVCPGFVRTPFVERQIPELAKEMGISESEVVKTVMLGDTVDGAFTTLDEVSETVLFLAAFPGAALTGQSVVVSHGWHMQ